MQHSDQNNTFERGFFQRAFQEFDEQRFFQSLEHRLQEQPYHRRHKGLKNTVLVFSYVLNFISAVSASYLIYWLTNMLTGVFFVACLVAGVFLFFLEQLKRKSSNEFFQVYFFQKRFAVGWLCLSLLCFGLSVGSTYFGTQQGTKDLAPDSTSISADSTEQDIKTHITKLETENATYEQQTTKEGIIYFPLQQAIQRNKEMIQTLRNRLISKEDTREQESKAQQKQHTRKINLTATSLAWILVFLEILFEGCIAYIWYYYYRSFIDWKHLQPQAATHIPNPSTHTNIAPPPSPTSPSPQSPDPIYNQNGTHYNQYGTEGSKVTNSYKPILGFLRADQRHKQDNLTENKKSDPQVCTDLYRDCSDAYTVPHSYQKGGKTITVHYTQQQIQARINQYQRELEEAHTRQMGQEIVNNRQEWLAYWQHKLEKIQRKTQKHKGIKV